jgi:hypothetical protein
MAACDGRACLFCSNTPEATEPIEPDGLCRLEVRAQAAFVLTDVYRVAGSTRSRPGYGSRRAEPSRPARRSTMPGPMVMFCNPVATVPIEKAGPLGRLRQAAQEVGEPVRLRSLVRPT